MAGEMAQWFSALTVLTEGLGLVPSIPVVVIPSY